MWYLVKHLKWWVLPEFPLRFFIGPLFYLYIATYLNPNYKSTQLQKILLWSPAIFDILITIVVSIWASTENFSWQQRIEFGSNQYFFLIHTSIAVAFNLLQSIYAYRKIILFYRKLKDVHGHIEFKKIRWSLGLSMVSIILWLIWLAFLGIEFFQPLSRNAYIPLFISLSLFVLIAGYYIVLRPYDTYYFNKANKDIEELYAPQSYLPEIDTMLTTKAERDNANDIQNEYKKVSLVQELIAYQEDSIEDSFSFLDSDEYVALPQNNINYNKYDFFSTLYQSIEQKMLEDEPFKDKEFSLSLLAVLMHQSSLNISKAIRYGSGKNFYFYVNEWRIKAFIPLFMSNQNNAYTIMALAHQCGFSSKATFHKYFKEITGTTPAQYKENHLS